MVTEDVSLKKILKWTYRIIALLGVFWLLYGGYKVILPQKTLTLDIRHPSRTSSLIKITSQNSLDFFTVLPQNFSRISITVFPNNKADFQKSSFEIYKTYEAFAYPLAGTRNHLDSDEVARLVSDQKSVYIVIKKKKMAIDNPLTFEAHGFLWNNVIPVQQFKPDLAQLENQSLYHLKDPHPDGTIFKTTDTHKFYYVYQQKKYLLTGQALTFPDLDKIAIPVAEKSLTRHVTCQLHEKKFPQKKKLSCQASLAEINTFPGSYYQFKSSGLTPQDVSLVKFSFSYSISRNNIKNSLTQTARRILNHFHIISLK